VKARPTISEVAAPKIETSPIAGIAATDASVRPIVPSPEIFARIFVPCRESILFAVAK
jgi:hypothetical protein